MLDGQDKEEIKKLVNMFTRKTFDKRIGDTPSDSLQLVPARYVNMYGSIAGRPASVAAAVGQQYFATDLGKPIFFGSNDQWVDSTGSVVAFN